MRVRGGNIVIEAAIEVVIDRLGLGFGIRGRLWQKKGVSWKKEWEQGMSASTPRANRAISARTYLSEQYVRVEVVHARL